MKCSIFKRTVCILLIVTFLTGISMPVFASDEDPHTESIGLNAFFENGYDTTLLDHNATGHMTFVEDMRGKVVGTLAMEVLAKIYEKEPEPNEAKYMEVLINIMMTYEMETAADLSEQSKMDTLKTAESLCVDAVKAGTGLLFELTNVDAAIEPLKDWLNIAVEGLGTLADNTENWIDGISDLNTLLQNYAKHDAFLYQIESLATGELQSAASKLRTSMTSAMKIKLETYSGISETNFQNYSKFFFEDMLFEALKLTEEYATDEEFQRFVELGSDVMDMVGAIDLGVEIGKLVGNVAVNGEDIINRVLEMKAVYDISVVLENWLNEVKTRSTAPYSEETDNLASNYVRSANYLISSRIRGEYCMYSLLAKNSGLYSHFGEETAKQAENVYNSLTYDLAEMKEQLDGVLNVLVVNVGSEMPYEAVNVNSQWNVHGSNGQLYDNYTLRIYDKQSLFNFVHTGPGDDPDPTVTEYVVDTTEPLTITLEEGYAYTFEFVDNADAEKTMLMAVGVTDDDPLLTSAVDVETDFGSNTQKLLNQIKVYRKNGDLDVLTNVKTFHYGDDSYLQSIDDEQFSTSGTSTNKGTVLIKMDSKGRMVKREPDINLEWDYEYVEYNYNDKDQLVSSGFYSSGPTFYFYDTEGRLIKEENGVPDMGSIVAEYIYEDNKLAKKVITTQLLGMDDLGPNVEEILYEVDAHGRIIKESNISRSSVTEYNYDYWPIVVFTTTHESGYVSSRFQYNDSEGHSIFTTVWLDDMEFFTDDEGCLMKISGLKNRVPYTYEFIYEQSQGGDCS